MPKTCCMVLVYVLVSCSLPPVAVLMSDGCGCTAIINVVLTIFGFIPGVIHALWVSLGKE